MHDHDIFARGGDVFYHPVYCDTVFRISSGFVAEPYCWLDFGSKTAPERLRNGRNRKEVSSEQAKDRYSFMIGDFFITDKHIFFEFLNKHYIHYVLYSKVSDRTLVFRSISGFFPIPFKNFVGTSGEAIVGYFFPSESIRRMDGLDLSNRDVLEKQFGGRMTELMCTMKNDDNPVITFFYPKNE